MGYKTVVQLAKTIVQPIEVSKVKARWLAAVSTEDWDTIRNLKIDPRDYSPDEGECYRNDAQISALLRKLDVLPSNVDKRQVAIDAFLQGEKRCKRTNEYLHRVLYYPVSMSKFDTEVRERAFLARAWIRKTLGAFPDFLDGRFGPGNVLEANEWAECHAYSKFIFQPSFTENFSAPLRRILVEDTAWGRAQLHVWHSAPVGRLADGSRLTTVRKDGSTDRAISISPGMNVYAQLSVGSYFKTRLNRVGIRMRPGVGKRGAPHARRYIDGQEFHRLLAREGSENGRWVTEDLRNASNHNALVAVRFLFAEWAELMDELREPCCNVPGPKGGKRYRLEMYSAMGNGFTFEVLTLMMLGLAYASGYVPGIDAFAYGDDVILENDYRVEQFNALLQVFGHELNRNKSFLDGPFRESCGGDYWHGRDVRPVIVDSVPKGPIEWMELYNHLLSKGFLAEETRRFILKQVEPKFRVFGPPPTAGVFHADRSWSFPSKHKAKTDRVHTKGLLMEGDLMTPVIRTVQSIPKRARLFPAAREPKILQLLGAMGIPLDNLAVRKDGKDEVVGHKLVWTPIPDPLGWSSVPSLCSRRMREWVDVTERIACSLVRPAA